MNSENKSQLVDGMNDVWSSHKFAPKLAWKKIITVPHGNCYLLASGDGTTVNKTEITSLFSNQKETDAVSMHKSKAMIQFAFAVLTVMCFSYCCTMLSS